MTPLGLHVIYVAVLLWHEDDPWSNGVVFGVIFPIAPSHQSWLSVLTMFPLYDMLLQINSIRTRKLFSPWIPLFPFSKVQAQEYLRSEMTLSISTENHWRRQGWKCAKVTLKPSGFVTKNTAGNVPWCPSKHLGLLPQTQQEMSRLPWNTSGFGCHRIKCCHIWQIMIWCGPSS